MNMTGPHDARLTAKQERFVAEYLVDYNGSAAYQRAGYQAAGNAAEVAACRLLRNVQVRSALNEARVALSEKTQVDAIWVETRLVEVVNRCFEPVPILDWQGNATGRYTFDSQGAIKALSLLGRRLGMFEEHEPGEPEQPLFLNLPPQVLLAWAARIRAQRERGVPLEEEEVGADPAPLGVDDMTEPPLENQPVSVMTVADEAPADGVLPSDDTSTENPPSDDAPSGTVRAQLLARLLTPSGLPPRPCDHCGVLFHPQMTEKQCCYACVCRAQGKTHRLQHTADCRRCIADDPLTSPQ